MSATPGRQRRERRLGQLMVEFGLLTEEQLATALAEQQRERRPLGELLVALGFASSAAVHSALSEQHGWSGGGEFGFGGRLQPRLRAVPDEPSAPSSAAQASTSAPDEPAADRDESELEQVASLRQLLEQSEAERARLRLELDEARAAAPGRRASRTHKLFVPTASGYRLLDRNEPAPVVGAEVDLVDGEAVIRYVVSKVARPSPPGAAESYVYLQHT
jgi:hypothetical protein